MSFENKVSLEILFGIILLYIEEQYFPGSMRIIRGFVSLISIASFCELDVVTGKL